MNVGDEKADKTEPPISALIQVWGPDKVKIFETKAVGTGKFSYIAHKGKGF